MSYVANMRAMAGQNRWRLKTRERQELLDLAGNQCAICHRILVEHRAAVGQTTSIAEAAHMYPHSDRGERGDLASRPALVDHVSNVIMLCSNCHTLVDWNGVGGRLWPLEKLRRQKQEHEAWIAFQRSRGQITVAEQPKLSGIDWGQSISVQGQAYQLPWDERPGRLDSDFAQEWSADRDAVRCRSYAYAHTGDARHAWLRWLEARDGSAVGEQWRRELIDEATLLDKTLPQLPGLPPVLGMETPPGTPVAVVTALPSAVSILDRYRTTGVTGLAEGSIRVLFAGLPTLCAALSALHDAGVAHGALNPQAILVDRLGNLTLRDLGLATAKATTGQPTKNGDIRRLATIVYELLTGIPPLTGADGPPVPASLRNPAVPEQAADALTQALSGDIRDARSFARLLRKR